MIFYTVIVLVILRIGMIKNEIMKFSINALVYLDPSVYFCTVS